MNFDQQEPVAEESADEPADLAPSFPPPRAVTELVVIDTAPHRAHAFWNILAEDFEAARARAGQRHPALVIRTHDVTGVPAFDGRNGHNTFDTVVNGLAGRTDLAIWKAGRTYLAELGLRRPDGCLERFAESDRFEMPPAPPAATLAHAAPVREAEERVLDAQEAGAILPPLPLQVGPWPDEQELLMWTRPAAPAAGGSAEEVAAAEPDRAPVPVLLVSGRPDLPAPHIEAEHRRMMAEVRDIPPPRVHERIAFGRPQAEAVASSLAERAPAPVAIETLFRSTSSSSGGQPVAAGCSAELVLRGRIEPGRAGTLFGRPVAVAPDGTFSVRLRLDHPAAALDQAGPDALL